MHKYMRAIGFSEKYDNSFQKKLMQICVSTASDRMYTIDEDDFMQADFSKDFTDELGLAVCGTFNDEDQFEYEYQYPYLKGKGVTSYEDIHVEQHSERKSYSGVCDDSRLGITLIFYLRNRISYIKAKTAGLLPIRGTSVTLSALSVEGTVIFPVYKNPDSVKKYQDQRKKREKLLNAAKEGNDEAIETLTMEDMDLYAAITKKIENSDLFTVIDTYLMPYGVECELYSVLGEIVAVEKRTNNLTGDQIYILTICANELTFDVSINIIDLMGIPEVGRRFKGVIWLQGYINFPS